MADCAAATAAINIADSPEGIERLKHLKARTQQFRDGLAALGMESIPGPHPVVPLMVRDTAKTHQMVQHLYEKGILVVGLTFPVVPKAMKPCVSRSTRRIRKRTLITHWMC
ncbi:MAG: aminotransferase class I/II-fold pyridoxal phosphate-dependent enzyme [Calditrichia bacterium]